MAKAINAEGQGGARPRRSELRQAAKSPSSCAAEFAGQGQGHRQRFSTTSSTDALRGQVLDEGERVDGRDAERSPPDHDRDRRAAARARFGALHAWPDAGARGRDARHRERRAAPRQHRRAAARQTKSFMLHYNFPPFSTGEVKPMRGTSRREIGHGNLAERAMQALLPAVRGVPVHAPHRVRDPRVERVVVDGVGVRRLAVAVWTPACRSRRRAPVWRWA